MSRFLTFIIAVSTIGFLSGVFANDANTGGHVGIIRTLSSYTLGKTGLHAGDLQVRD